MSLQDITLKSYNENYEKYLDKAISVASSEYLEVLDFFIENLSGEKKVLEIGSGSLRDAKYLRERGVKVTCTDVATRALELAKENNFESFYFDFRDGPQEKWVNNFEGVFCSAVLLHANEEQFVFALKNIYKLLKNDGVFFLALKGGEGETVETQKLDAPRYFKFWKKEDVEKISEGLKFINIKYGQLDGATWIYFVFRK